MVARDDCVPAAVDQDPVFDAAAAAAARAGNREASDFDVARSRDPDDRFRAQPLAGASQVGEVVVQEVAAGDKEAGDVLLLIEERKHADADAAGDAEEHGFGEGRAGVGVADAGMRQEPAQGGRGRNAAGEVPGRVVRRLSGRAFQTTARSSRSSSARPRRVSFCLRASQSRREGTK